MIAFAAGLLNLLEGGFTELVGGDFRLFLEIAGAASDLR